jgi:DNA-binding transcriptional regulator YdaS (Cro superfamily)
MAKKAKIRKDPGLAAVLAAGKRLHQSYSKLARKIGISPQSLNKWDEVPPERVIVLEQLTGVPREIIRPDLYPPRRPKRVGASAHA